MDLHYVSVGPDTYVMRQQAVRLTTHLDIAEWEALMRERSETLLLERGGAKWWCLIDLGEYELNPELAADYGERARTFVERYFLGCVRFGDPEGLCSKSALRIGALKNRFPSNLFRDENAAQVAIAGMQRFDA
ncbi:MAG: hypothetical protein AB8I08_29835 [Sandaracinaceae bacterium]